MTVIIFILILGLLVLAHEFGHFICARKAGMRVYEFGFGFPPRAFGVYKDPVTRKFVWVFGRIKSPSGDHVAGLINTAGGGKREEEFPATVYSLNWLPLGGFCKIKGEEGENKNETDSFASKVAWKKVVVLAAGVTMNVILAAVLLMVGFMIGLPTDLSGGIDKQAIVISGGQATVQFVEKNSPAEKAGIKFGDKVVQINDLTVQKAEEMVNYISLHHQDELSVKIKRGEALLAFQIKPAIIRTGETSPRLGVTLADAGIVRYPWHVALYKGLVATGYGIINIAVGFYLVIKNLILGHGLIAEIAGPVGIAVMVGQSVRLGLSYIINLTAMLSLTLAVINILPIPALDGGRILFIAVEKIFKKPVPLKYEQLAHTIGFVLLMALIVLVTWRDVRGLF